MKYKKEILYIPVFIVAIYLLDKLHESCFSSHYNNRQLYSIIEYIVLFIARILIGVEKTAGNNKLKFIFNKARFFLAFIPAFVLLSITSGTWLVLSFEIVDSIKLPAFLAGIIDITMYNRVGYVLLGYFLATSIIGCSSDK